MTNASTVVPRIPPHAKGERIHLLRAVCIIQNNTPTDPTASPSHPREDVPSDTASRTPIGQNVRKRTKVCEIGWIGRAGVARKIQWKTEASRLAG